MPELASGGAVAARDALREALLKPLAGEELSRDEAVALLATPELTAALLATASALRDRAWGRTVTFSPKVFLPVANLCRDRCTYCTFRKDPDDPEAWTMTPDEIATWSACGPAAPAARGGGAPEPLHDRHPRPHRRDARRGRRPAPRHPRAAPRLRARAGGARAELPRQADQPPSRCQRASAGGHRPHGRR